MDGVPLDEPQHPSSKCAAAGAQGSACDLCTAKPSARALFFNRVPKCGSTTLEKLIKMQARKHRFHFERSHDYINNSIDVLEQRRVVSPAAG
jgi:hypothetical protein